MQKGVLMSESITVRAKKFQQKHNFCLTNLHNRLELTGNQLQIQLQQLILTFEASINLSNSFINLETLLSVFIS